MVFAIKTATESSGFPWKPASAFIQLTFFLFKCKADNFSASFLNSAIPLPIFYKNQNSGFALSTFHCKGLDW